MIRFLDFFNLFFMQLLDIHTHCFLEDSSVAIQNCSPEGFLPQSGRFYSVGIHPWEISSDVFESWDLLVEAASHPQVLAVGECGLDGLVGVDWGFQKEVFRRQVDLAASLQKPLVIHSVRAYESILALKKECAADVPWVIHGFRGKKELACQLVRHGFYLSFGEYYHQDALTSIPVDRLFLETDESLLPILTLYDRAANCLSLAATELIERVQRNISRVFFNK